MCLMMKFLTLYGPIGVLHHTKNPKLGFDITSKYLEKEWLQF